MTYEQQKKAIQDYSLDLIALAIEYEKAAKVLDQLGPEVIAAMLQIAVRGNAIHNEIADTVAEIQAAKSN